jgi:dTDP-4-dehydrorhamnose reductase
MPDGALGGAQVMERGRAPMELWGGIEPTHNRVGDRYHSQLDRSGHHARLSDLERCAALGIRTLRYPVLWERTMPQPDAANWAWPDERLARLRELGITPIVGLLHHGSGPPHTSLVDPRFAEKLADYAGRVAARYPWVDHYTPVNEPLTTALFSGLYGVWYPHERSDRAFTTALLGQCRATILSMRAIREVNPCAKLVQTDDLGATYSTPLLIDQARFNNERRWLGWDLLYGIVDRDHALWDWLIECGGTTEAELRWFVEHRCPPDIIGVNHYVTSERYLTENLDSYATRYHGGNGRQRYADVEAVRCLAHTPGITALLMHAWDRYRLPLAITEAHIDSTREDQLRWIVEMWRAAEKANRGGADVRAVTLWALFGTYDWNCLATACRGYYEPGAFDARTSPPRPTAIAGLAKSLSRGVVPSNPTLSGHGWWKRPGRFYADPEDTIDLMQSADPPTRPTAKTKPILITGATGTLGSAFARICDQRGLAYVLLNRRELDIADAPSVDAALGRHDPWAIVNAAGYVRVDDAESDVDRCFRDNTVGPQNLADACARGRIGLVTFSTDLVFDGERDAPYVETDSTAPLNVYGRSKAEAERRVLERHPAALVVRTSAFFGPWDEYNYVAVVLRALRDGKRFLAARDLVVSPTYVPDLVHTVLDLLIDGAYGIWHLTSGEPVSWAELAMRAADVAKLSPTSLVSCSSADLDWVARRPRYSALMSNRSSLMPSLASSLARYMASAAQPLLPLAIE